MISRERSKEDEKECIYKEYPNPNRFTNYPNSYPAKRAFTNRDGNLFNYLAHGNLWHKAMA